MSLEKIAQIGNATGGLASNAANTIGRPDPHDSFGFGFLNGKLLEGVYNNWRDGKSELSPQGFLQTIEVARAQGLHHTSLNGFAAASKQQQNALKDQLANLFHAGDKPPEGILGHVGAAFGVLTSLEQLATMWLGAIPFPAVPAVRIGDNDVGVPHGHVHPPNLIPPAPMVPLPSMGMTLKIPYLSGADTVKINDMPAARCGDLGASIWCGSYVPIYEIFLGSANVWIEGARAARVACDVTSHCIFSVRPKPGDRPVGCPIGVTVSSSANVMIGGIPCPSLTNAAVGAAMKLMFKTLGKAIQKMRGAKAATAAFERSENTIPGMGPAKRPRKVYVDTIDYAANYVRAGQLVEQMEKSKKLVINGTLEFIEKVKRDLRRIACSEPGRQALEEIRDSNHQVTIEHLNDAPTKELREMGNHTEIHDPAGAKNGTGSDSTVRYDPDAGSRGTPSDASANHELGHSRDAAQGTHREDKFAEPEANKQWSNIGERNNIVNHDNAYRRARGLPEREGHGHLPWDTPY